MDEKKLLFLHIPKTAGTTLKTMIAQNYSQSEIYDAYDYKLWESGFQSLDNKEEIKLIQGHFRFGFHEFIKPYNCQYFTFLRKPVDLTISHYFHLVRSKNPEHKRRIEGIESLEDFAKIHSAYNLQTRIISGVYDIDEFKAREEELFQTALNNLENKIDCIGIQERFTESVVAISQLLNWKKNMYTSTNIGGNVRKDMDPGVKQIILDHNKLDTQLYEAGLKKFEAQIANIPKFDKKVKFYLQKKRVYDKLYPKYQNLKAKIKG